MAKRSAMSTEEDYLFTVYFPSCRKETQISEIGKLQTAFYLKSLFEIKKT